MVGIAAVVVIVVALTAVGVLVFYVISGINIDTQCINI